MTENIRLDVYLFRWLSYNNILNKRNTEHRNKSYNIDKLINLDKFIDRDHSFYSILYDYNLSNEPIYVVNKFKGKDYGLEISQYNEYTDLYELYGLLFDGIPEGKSLFNIKSRNVNIIYCMKSIPYLINEVFDDLKLSYSSKMRINELSSVRSDRMKLFKELDLSGSEGVNFYFDNLEDTIYVNILLDKKVNHTDSIIELKIYEHENLDKDCNINTTMSSDRRHFVKNYIISKYIESLDED